MKCLLLSRLHVLLVLFIFHFRVCGSSSSSITPVVAPTLCHSDESSALLHFKASLQIATTPPPSVCSVTSHAKTSSWNESASCCEWDGITCDPTSGDVIGLDLSCARLKGILSPNSSLFSLRHLESLNLSCNDFRGSSVLPELGQFKNMTVLDLSGSNFSGNIPSEIAHLSKLATFSVAVFPEDEQISIGAATFRALALNLTDLRVLSMAGVDMSAVSLASMANLSSSLTFLGMAYCGLHGVLPETLFHFPKLDYLNLAGNNLNGHFPWPSLNFEHLRFFDLSNNNFTGQIPELCGNSSQNSSVFPSSLIFFRLSNNSLEGIIPSWIFKPPSLSLLDLANNHFTGKLYEFSSSSLQYLSLAENKLHGLIPSSIFQNVELDLLDLSSNNFSGNLELEKLSKLRDLSYLSLSSNNFSLTFKSSIKSLSWKSLETLDLSSNSFSGPLPSFSSPLLSHFFASKNQFSGTIPTSICNFKSLDLLDLSNNNFTGKIPECIGNFSQNLSLLNLERNKLHGMIPQTFLKRSKLRNMNLNGNELEGALPRSLIFCKSLEVLDLGNNRLVDTFPDWLESLPKLRILVLRANMFQGPIGNPISKSPFPELRIIDLSYNGFSGALPAKYLDSLKAMRNPEEYKMEYMGERYYQDTVTVTIKGFLVELVKIQTILTTIDLSNNKFTGEIPELIGNHNSLKGLNLSNNMLKGTIPTSVGKLTNLEWLDLSSNELVGKIPSELLDIKWLAVLNLSRNHLLGPIPQGKQFNTFSNDSYAENSGLCGFPLTKRCGDQKASLESSSPTPVHEGSSIMSGFNGKIVLMGYASGFVIGISIGYILLYSDGRLSWLCKRIEGKLQQNTTVRRTGKKGKARVLQMARQ